MPQHDVDKMPIFRYGGQLAANRKGGSETVGAAVLPTARVANESGYVCAKLPKTAAWPPHSKCSRLAFG